MSGRDAGLCAFAHYSPDQNDTQTISPEDKSKVEQPAREVHQVSGKRGSTSGGVDNGIRHSQLPIKTISPDR